jgi:hypothetical protein
MIRFFIFNNLSGSENKRIKESFHLQGKKSLKIPYLLSEGQTMQCAKEKGYTYTQLSTKHYAES